MNIIRLTTCAAMALGAGFAAAQGLWITAIIFAVAFVCVADVWYVWWVEGNALEKANASLRLTAYRAHQRATEAEGRANLLQAELDAVRSAVAPGLPLHESQRADQ